MKRISEKKTWLNGHYSEIIHVKISSYFKIKQVVEVITSWYESGQQCTYEIENGRDDTKEAKMSYFHYSSSS